MLNWKEVKKWGHDMTNKSDITVQEFAVSSKAFVILWSFILPVLY